MTDWSRPPEVDDDYDPGDYDDPLPGEGPHDGDEEEPSEARCDGCGAILTTEERGIDWAPWRRRLAEALGEEFEPQLCARCR